MLSSTSDEWRQPLKYVVLQTKRVLQSLQQQCVIDTAQAVSLEESTNKK